MSTRRFIAPNMQAALKQIRETLGAEAQILTTRKVAGGIEVVCAPEGVDPWALPQEPPLSAQPEPAVQRDEAALSEARADARRLASLESELAGLRKLVAELPRSIESRVAAQPVHKHPCAVTEALARLGFSEPLIHRLARQPQAMTSLQQALTQLVSQLAFPSRGWLRLGGAHALVGPAGAGKTTTIAKLATLARASHGPDRVALVSIDRYRLAAMQQLQALGRVMNLPVMSLGPRETLDDLLDQLADRSLVLIDTAGLNPSDPDWREQLQQLAPARNRLHRHLVLPATSQAAVQQAAVRAWSGAGLHSVVLSKLDEAQSLGESLSLLIGEGLEWSWLTDGQSLSGHLHAAAADPVMARILRFWREKSPQQSYTDASSPTPAQRAG